MELATDRHDMAAGVNHSFDKVAKCLVGNLLQLVACDWCCNYLDHVDWILQLNIRIGIGCSKGGSEKRMLRVLKGGDTQDDREGLFQTLSA